MTTSLLAERRCESAGRQAKKLAVSLDVPLTRAMKVLACGPYRCANWDDLLQRLGGPTPPEHAARLADLPASPEAQSYFFSVRKELARSLAEYQLTNANLLGLVDIVQKVFAVSNEQPTLCDVIPTLPTSNWRSASIGPDPEAVLHAETVLGAIRLKLVATRVYLPEFYDFGDELQPEYAVPYGETLKIVWADPQAWRQAAKDYAEDSEAEDVLLPEIALSESMELHRLFFERCLETLGHSREYGGGDEKIIPLFIRDSSYVVYGFPMARSEVVSHDGDRDNLPEGDGDGCYRVVLVDQTPVVLDWIAFDPMKGEHPGEFTQYFETLRAGVLSQGPLLTTNAVGATPGILTIQPADGFHVRNALKVEFTHEPGRVAFVLQTDAVEATSQLLDSVAKRNLTMIPSGDGANFVAEVALSPDSEHDSPSLSMTISSDGHWSSEHLVRQARVAENGGGRRAVLEISPRLLKVMDLLGHKEVERALKEGHVLRMPAEFLTELDDPPVRSTRLPIAPPELLRTTPIPADAILQFSSIRYLRDSF